MRFAPVLLLLIGATAVLAVGAELYDGTGFIVWAFLVVVAGAVAEVLFHRRGARPSDDDEEGGRAMANILLSGSVLRMFPPFLTSIAFVLTITLQGMGLSIFPILPLLLVPTVSSLISREK